MNREIIRTPNLTADAAAFILRQARQALAERGEFRMALSGGNTPRPIYTEFGRMAHDLPWRASVSLFGDERCVTPDDPASNYRMARESLFDPYAIPEESILRMRARSSRSSRHRNTRMRSLSWQRSTAKRFTGTICSSWDGRRRAYRVAFPGTAALDEQVRRVVANFVPNLKSWRLTMTFPSLINRGRSCFSSRATRIPGSWNASGRRRRVSRQPGQSPHGQLSWMIGEGPNEVSRRAPFSLLARPG
jgi:6-phosphogluconolactonase